MSPFFWVQETEKEDEANMTWGGFEDPLEEQDFKLTFLKNRRALKKDEILKVFKSPPPAAEAQPTKTVIVEPAPKRQRKGGDTGKGKGKSAKATPVATAAARAVKAAEKADAKKGNK